MESAHETPRFSVIVPVYNTARELARCVESILSQSFGDLELLLVDDGSTDGSGALCDKLAQADGRTRVVHQKNAGCSEARNAGILLARGDYLLFVDSDDCWDSADALAQLSDCLRREGEPDLAVFGVRICRADGSAVKTRLPQVPQPPTRDKEAILRQLVYTNQYFSPCYVKALRRDFFLTRELFFIKGLLSEDIEWSARVMIGCRSLAVYPRAFYKRIERSEGSITSDIGRKNLLDILAQLEQGVPLVRSEGQSEALQALYLEYWAYQYAMLLALMHRLRREPDYGALLTRLKPLRFLLRYDHVNKVRAVRLLTAALGLRGACAVLSLRRKRSKL